MNSLGLGGGFGTLLIGIVVAIVVFLILREVVTWYWKLNKISNQLDQVSSMLGLLLVYQTQGRKPEDTSISHINKVMESLERSKEKQS